MLKIVNYHKSYDDKEVVKGISLEVLPGEIYGFIGHNGAGKSTTIKSVVGILEFEQGDILIDGMSIQQDPVACKQKIAYIPDNPDLYENLSGIQYLHFVGNIFGVDKEIRYQRIEELAKELDLYEHLGDSISSYSHGMKQKLSLISAMMHEPKLMVLDEPFVGLDPKATYILKKRMRQMCDNGCSIFFSTHVLEVVEKLCDHVAIIKNGEIVTMGPTEEIIKNQSLEEVFLELEAYETTM